MTGDQHLRTTTNRHWAAQHVTACFVLQVGALVEFRLNDDDSRLTNDKFLFLSSRNADLLAFCCCFCCAAERCGC